MICGGCSAGGSAASTASSMRRPRVARYVGNSTLVTVPTVAVVSVSLNSKPLHVCRSFPLHADIFDPGTCRPAPHAGHELFQRPDVAFSDDLDATVGYVARPSGHPPPLSLLQGEEPKPHPLHATADPQVAAGGRLRNIRLASVIHWPFPIAAGVGGRSRPALRSQTFLMLPSRTPWPIPRLR